MIAGGSGSRAGRRRTLAAAGIYLAVAWGCVLYAWLDPGRYSLAFLLPLLATAPTSVLAVVAFSTFGASGLQSSPGIVATVLAGCGLIQAAGLYILFNMRSDRTGCCP